MKNETTIDDYAQMHGIVGDGTADMAWVDRGSFQEGFSVQAIKKEDVDPSKHTVICPAWSCTRLLSLLPRNMYSHESVIPYTLTITQDMNGYWVSMYYNDTFKPGYKTLMESQDEELVDSIMGLVRMVYKDE